jgi:hypothetical protein
VKGGDVIKMAELKIQTISAIVNLCEEIRGYYFL